MKALELFAGCGGMTLGCSRAGFEHEKLIEFDYVACDTLRLNHPADCVHEGDVRAFDARPYAGIDLVCGGPPCQPFSLSGQSRANLDPRDMWPEAARIVAEARPRAFMFENVPGLLRAKFKEYFDLIILRLRFPGVGLSSGSTLEEQRAVLSAWAAEHAPEYAVSYKILNAADFGVPQMRRRVFVVGLRADEPGEFTWPEPTHCEGTLLFERDVTGEYWRRHHCSPGQGAVGPLLCASRRTPAARPALPGWRTVRDALPIAVVSPPPIEGPEHGYRLGAIIGGHGRESYFDRASNTIMSSDRQSTNMIVFSPDSMRYMTPWEAKILQSFPPEYQLAGSRAQMIKQIGNAVPPPLAAAVACKVAQSLGAMGLKNEQSN